MTSKWSQPHLLREATLLCHRAYQKYKWTSHKHPFWLFYWQWKTHAPQLINRLIQGRYQPQPMIAYYFGGETEPYWPHVDRVIQRILYVLIKPTFKYIIEKTCLHLGGPSAIKKAAHHIEQALKQTPYRYIIRTDIKSYYSSINHSVLKKQIRAEFDDPRVIHQLCNIIDVPIDYGGYLRTPQTGISRKSSFSSFFAALYLKPLDIWCASHPHIFYCRYNDDIILLCRSKRQCAKAKRALKNILNQLKLRLAPTKTKIGLIDKGFHFLGMNFEVAQTPQKVHAVQNNEDTLTTHNDRPEQLAYQYVRVSLHPQSYHRSIDQWKIRREGVGNPTEAQIYLGRWARWWAHAHHQIQYNELLEQWRLVSSRVTS